LSHSPLVCEDGWGFLIDTIECLNSHFKRARIALNGMGGIVDRLIKENASEELILSFAL